MKVVLLSTAMLALTSSAIAKPVPEDGATNKVPISWSDVESGPHNAQHAHQGEAHNHDLHARAPGKMSKAEILADMDKYGKYHAPGLTALAEKAEKAEKAKLHARAPGKSDAEPHAMTLAALEAAFKNGKLHARGPGKSGAEGSGVNRAGRPKADHKIEDSNPMNQWKRDPRVNTANAKNVNAAAAAANGGECEGAGSGCFGDVTHYVSSVPLDTL